jgi:hypothetical protein
MPIPSLTPTPMKRFRVTYRSESAPECVRHFEIRAQAEEHAERLARKMATEYIMIDKIEEAAS